MFLVICVGSRVGVQLLAERVFIRCGSQRGRSLSSPMARAPRRSKPIEGEGHVWPFGTPIRVGMEKSWRLNVISANADQLVIRFKVSED